LPRTAQVIDNVFKEYLTGPNPVFTGSEVGIGTDEYTKEES
jgi:hexosaminidase